MNVVLADVASEDKKKESNFFTDFLFTLCFIMLHYLIENIEARAQK